VYGVWCVVYGVWCVWCVVCGVWCVVYGVWCVVCGVWCVVCDHFNEESQIMIHSTKKIESNKNGVLSNTQNVYMRIVPCTLW